MAVRCNIIVMNSREYSCFVEYGCYKNSGSGKIREISGRIRSAEQGQVELIMPLSQASSPVDSPDLEGYLVEETLYGADRTLQCRSSA